jgi:hypothetical protein
MANWDQAVPGDGRTLHELVRDATEAARDYAEVMGLIEAAAPGWDPGLGRRLDDARVRLQEADRLILLIHQDPGKVWKGG